MAQFRSFAPIPANFHPNLCHLMFAGWLLLFWVPDPSSRRKQGRRGSSGRCFPLSGKEPPQRPT